MHILLKLNGYLWLLGASASTVVSPDMFLCPFTFLHFSIFLLFSVAFLARRVFGSTSGYNMPDVICGAVTGMITFANEGWVK